MPKKAIVAGASGLIGSSLVKILLECAEYDHVLLLIRKALPLQHPKLSQEVIDFDQLDNYSKLIEGDALFCCLGSTRKKTPDLTAYRKIDHDYPVKLATIGVQNKIGQFHFVSAIGANASSSNFYTKMKGETENALKALGLTTLQIYQPSLLTGDRKKRFVEKLATVLMKVIDPILIGGLKKYRSIPAHTVAMAMYKQSLTPKEGVFTHPSDQIKQLA